MGHLFLDKLDDRFDPDSDRAAGPWCLIGTRHLVDDWSRFEFVEPFVTPQEEISAADDCAVLVRFHLGRLAEDLNRRHGIYREFPFWWSLLIAWLQHLVETSWRQWCHAEKIVARDGHREMTFDAVSAAEATPWRFADTRDFVYRGLRSPQFIGWMMSGFVERQCPGLWSAGPRILAAAGTDESPVTVEPPVSSNGLKRLVRRMFRRLPARDLPGISSASLWLSGYVSLLPRRSAPDDFRGVPADRVPDIFPQAFLDALDHLIVQTMPLSFGKDFHRYDADAAALTYRPGRLFVTAPTIFEDRRSFEIAHAVAAGERVVRVQHGSEYGTAAVFNIGWMNEFVNAGFLTWGWTGQSDFPGRFMPVSAPPLAGLKDAHRQESSNILLVGTAASLVPFRIVSALKPSAMDRYMADKSDFASALSPGLSKYLVYRPYRRGQMELPDTGWLDDLDNPPAIHTEALTPALLRCRLAVLDHPGTTLNITLAANTPTICFWRPELAAYCDQAMPYFDRLKAVGILHDDPGSAAAHVNAIADDVAGWWRAEDVQSARRAWADTYARTDRVWWWSWLTALRKI